MPRRKEEFIIVKTKELDKISEDNILWQESGKPFENTADCVRHLKAAEVTGQYTILSVRKRVEVSTESVTKVTEY